MSKHLIVNADDYGRTASVSRGIRQAHLHGIVTTTTAMMNFPTAQEDLRVAMAECPRLGLGVHLTLTAGHPVLPPEQVQSLVTGRGLFPSMFQFVMMEKRINSAELRAEWQAQIGKFLATGAMLDHLDSHHHTSYLSQIAFNVMLDLANEYRVSIRSPFNANTNDIAGAGAFAGQSAENVRRLIQERQIKRPDNFVAGFFGKGATLANLCDTLNTLPDGVTEIMCHPGFVDEDILNNSSYDRQREEEIKVLTSVEVREAIQEHGIELATFGAVL
ncbi:MAG: ChbG/HpnK family deacetylase [Chloroflexi bacterium]|nr:ChbG/HpnK family deacetylase [Chloroflexota bacterium]